MFKHVVTSFTPGDLDIVCALGQNREESVTDINYL